MFKVLLVDDEPYVIDLLKNLIDWEKHGFRLCGEATNGEDALKIIHEMNPHLVITDIQMPIMNGLELIEHTTEMLHLKTKFIILSAYDEFAYAKKAMRLKVNDYILKPIDDEELIPILNRMHSSFQNEIHSQKVHEEQLKFIANNSIHRLLRGEIKESLIKRVQFLLKLSNEEPIRCILVEIDHFENLMGDLDEVEIQSKRISIRNAIETSMHNNYSLHVFEDNIQRFGLIISDKMLLENEIESFLFDLKKTVMDQCKCSITLAASSKMAGVECIGTLYKQAQQVINYKFYRREGCILYYHHLKSTMLNYDFEENNMDVLMDDIKNYNINGIENEVDKMFDLFSRSMKAPEAVKALISIYELETVKLISGSNGNVSDFSKEITKYNTMMGNVTMQEIKKLFYDFCLYSAQYFEEIRKKNAGDVILEIKKYIKENYSKDLKLQKIAKIVYMNPVYLGQLFKKSMGTQFNEYVHEVRIEEAKKLLKRTDMKIADIAFCVGYSDVEYFVSNFKTKTQTTPTAYKNSSF